VNREEDVFVEDPATVDRLSAAFSEGPLNELGRADVFGAQYSAEVREQKLHLASESLSDLLALNEDIELAFGLVIHSIFIKASKPTPGWKGVARRLIQCFDWQHLADS
jgi:hypothetical protein